jgi:hypothetical protein
MIGIDSHKGSHTAVAIGDGEVVVAVGASDGPAGAGVDGVGRRPGRQGADLGGGVRRRSRLPIGPTAPCCETVVGIPATLAARVRLLGSGRSDQNDPNDARWVAIAALRAPSLVPVRAEDHATVLRLLSQRHLQLGWSYNRAACRLHGLVADPVPGGISKKWLFARPDRCSRTTAPSALRGLRAASTGGRPRRWARPPHRSTHDRRLSCPEEPDWGSGGADRPPGPHPGGA